MVTVLYNKTIFGPIKSRRLGVSLGVNLMPNDGKMCSFDCLYCEAGFNGQGAGSSGVPSRKEVANRLRTKLRAMSEAGEPLDSITFSGNGEPTLHPEFEGVVADVVRLRNVFYPNAKVTVLTNGTMAFRPAVAKALRSVDNNVLKLDSAIGATMRSLNRPVSPNVVPEGLIATFKEFAGKCLVQTLLTRGSHDGILVDNTTDIEVNALIEAYKAIQPRCIQLYSVDRPTPEPSMNKVPLGELQSIAHRITAATGIPVQVN